MGTILDQILDWLTTAILDCLDAVLNLIIDVLLTTPQVTALPQVQTLTGRSIWIVDTTFVLVFVAAGVLTMVSGGNEQSRYTVKDLAPRLVVGFIAAHFSQLFCRQLIELGNAVTGAISQDYDGERASAAMRIYLQSGQEHIVPLLFVIIVTVITVLIVVTAFQLIARIVTLLIMTIIAPLALACHALPATEDIARLWWRSYLGCLAIPAAQAFFLTAGQWMLSDPTHTLPVLDLPVEPGGVLNLLVVIVLLWTTVKIPSLVGRWVGQSGHGGSNIVGAVVRVAVVQQIARSVPGLNSLRRVTR
ncbi:conjugal transfer protein TrbL family protein [Plantactinospora sp. CA-290183]|uniref:conjugal transfer protein TrbL family protein n=1 Tax=Plantactinospora sp. CA-290183 TaxID=3240006 RepID=UPI003D935695